MKNNFIKKITNNLEKYVILVNAQEKLTQPTLPEPEYLNVTSLKNFKNYLYNPFELQIIQEIFQDLNIALWVLSEKQMYLKNAINTSLIPATNLKQLWEFVLEFYSYISNSDPKLYNKKYTKEQKQEQINNLNLKISQISNPFILTNVELKKYFANGIVATIKDKLQRLQTVMNQAA